MVVKFLVMSGGACVRELPISRPRTVVGRKKGCKLRIPSASVSRVHCVIIRQANRIFLKDLGSSNGTIVNGARIEVTELKAGDKLNVGTICFLVEVDGKPNVPRRRPSEKGPAPETEVVFITDDQEVVEEGSDEFVAAEEIDPAAESAETLAAEEQQEADVIDASQFIIEDDDPKK